ncbi:MAG TPA: sigma-54 dependent transcriptional regulator, partial [Oligoflexia bacterium]|nr:sigma-54 dependent transcriptional regulator [Oligoflexia bacterium]
MATESKAILIIEDEASMVEMLEMALKKWGYRVRVARNLHDGLAAVERGRVDLVLSDIKLPDGSGIDILGRVNTLPERPPVIFMTAFGSAESAVQAMKLGATNYISKPFKLEALRELLQESLKKHHEVGDTGATGSVVNKIEEPLTATSGAKRGEFSRSNIIGQSKALRELFQLVDRVAKTKTNILVTGESGTGKELVARAIHAGGPLKNTPFVAVNCGAIPETLIESELFGHKRGSFTGAVADKEGLFQVANGGTIFLDEVGELPMSMQVKLLRVLQDRTLRPVGGTEDIKVDVRVISATNRDLEQEIARGKFREDLYYRLNVIHIKSPPLRSRKEDIPLLVDFFIKKFGLSIGKTIKTISAAAMNALMHYDFPGNVRE